MHRQTDRQTVMITITLDSNGITDLLIDIDTLLLGFRAVLQCLKGPNVPNCRLYITSYIAVLYYVT